MNYFEENAGITSGTHQVHVLNGNTQKSLHSFRPLPVWKARDFQRASFARWLVENVLHKTFPVQSLNTFPPGRVEKEGSRVSFPCFSQNIKNINVGSTLWPCN